MNKVDVKKKLELNRETVTKLQDAELQDVNGASLSRIVVNIVSRWVGSAVGWVLC